MRSSFFDASVDQSDNNEKGPLKHWNSAVRKLTAKCVGRDILPCYKVMVKLVNQAEFENKLSADASLFPVAPSSPSKSIKKQ